MKAIRAARILTMDPGHPEIADGGILIREGRILAVGPWKAVAASDERHDLGDVALAPALINAHAHLELSHLAGRIPAGLGFAAWADRLFDAMRDGRVTEEAISRAVGRARAAGLCCVADVVGREFDLVRRVLERSHVAAHLFREFSGRGRGGDFCPEPLPGAWSPAVHALYSTDSAFAQAVKGWCSSRALPFTLHLAEAPGENELFERGSGEFADFLRARRILPKGFAAPGLSATAFARELGLLDSRTLAVHCVGMTGNDVDIMAGSGAFACLCPRSNRHIGVGEAPAALLRMAGVPLCLGTDSLASAPDLDLWEELRAVRSLLPPDTPLADLLAMVTRNPARVLGLDTDFGSLAEGRRAVWSVLPVDFARQR
jgi:cytosine/adenosine deaminase-related metal-dependent hydrolase